MVETRAQRRNERPQQGAALLALQPEQIAADGSACNVLTMLRSSETGQLKLSRCGQHLHLVGWTVYQTIRQVAACQTRSLLPAAQHAFQRQQHAVHAACRCLEQAEQACICCTTCITYKRTCCIHCCGAQEACGETHMSCSLCPCAAAAAAAAQAPHCQLAADLHQPTAVQPHTAAPQRCPADSGQGLLLSRCLVLPISSWQQQHGKASLASLACCPCCTKMLSYALFIPAIPDGVTC
jgi:hypothetical protein